MNKIIFILLFSFGLTAQKSSIPFTSIITYQQGVVPTPIEGSFKLGQLKAFPSADGFAKFKTGGRGGTIVKITNNNTSGAGSLKAALDLTYSRIIIGGQGIRIDAGANTTSATEDNFSILGQTFTGSGITHYGNMFEVLGASNFIIRHVEFLGGDSQTDSGRDAFRIIARFTGNPSIDGGILDHCSFMWGDDENISMAGDSDGRSVQNITIQNSIIGEAFKSGKGILLFDNSYRISLLNNLSTNNKDRGMARISVGTASYEIINNLSYNSDWAPFQLTWQNVGDYIGNVDVKGGNAQYGNQIVFGESANNGSFTIADTRLYAVGNYLDGASQNSVSGNTWSEDYRETSKIHATGSRVISSTAEDLETFVLANVGANVSTSTIEQSQIDDYTNGTGSYSTTEAQTVGLPTHTAGTEPTDTDGDHIPDAWEIAMGLDEDSDADATVKPDSFTIDSRTYDNREYTGGSYNGFIYSGGTLTGSNLYDWREIYWEDLANGFQTMHYE